MQSTLNRQLAEVLHLAALPVMFTRFEALNLGFARWMRIQSDEEHEHASTSTSS